MKLEETRNRRILISPLNWGMGHVSRCVGLINDLQNRNNTVIIACNDDQKSIFEQYFKDVLIVKHRGYPFVFGGKGNFAWDLLVQFNKLKNRLKDELNEVEKLIEEHNIDVLISDHRYGFRSQKVTSIFVTHQLNLPLFWYEFPIQIAHKRLLKKFDRVWVMDFLDNRLAGKLSRNSDLYRTDYIGPFSRFQLYEIPSEKKFDEVFVASGPAIYAQQLIDLKLGKKKYSNVVVLANDPMEIPVEIKVKSGDWIEQDKIILSAKKIISRSGYSTYMDLYYLGIESDLIPTIGQREQIYLKKLHTKQQTEQSEESNT